MTLHPLAQRQLNRYFKEGVPREASFDLFIKAISDAYEAADEDRAMLERTLALVSKETEDRYVALQSDIAARERAESERDAFFRTSLDLLSIFDAKLCFVQANERWLHTLGYEPQSLVGQPMLSLVHPDEVERISAQSSKVRETGFIQDFEFRIISKSGETKWISAAASLDKSSRLIFTVCRDVTVQRAMAHELAQANKLEAVGQLASGVAHEINTPIQYVGDNVQFAEDGFVQLFSFIDRFKGTLSLEQQQQFDASAHESDLPYLREELPKSLREGRDGLRRVAELVRALKEFAHPDQVEKSPADLNEALARAVVLARGELRHVSRVETKFSELPKYPCHIGSLSQVFLNLLVNAAHAIEERTQKQKVGWDSHRITVSSRREGNEIVISFADTGCGIPESIRERIYEPFFTTKPVGKGSGQGLPLVRNVIIGKHGGRIELESVVNQGTVFTLRLPFETQSASRAA
jgi:PAS domain S-box-containing protein